MAFLDNMRMASLYPPSFQSSGGGVDFGSFLTGINQMKNQQIQDEIRRDQMPLSLPEITKIRQYHQLEQEANAQKPMNIVLGHSEDPSAGINAAEDRISKWEYPKNQQIKDALKSKEDKTNQELGFKYDKLNTDTGYKYAKQEQDSKIRQQRADVYKFKAEHPDEHLIFPKGGNVMSVHPITHKVTDLGIDNGTLSDQDRLDLQQSNAIQSIEERGNQQRQTNTERLDQQLGNQKSLIETRQELQKPKELIPTQTRVQQQNKAETLFNTHPEWQNFIKILPNHTGFNVMPPGTNGLDEETFHKINNEIYNLGGKDIQLKPDTKISDTKTDTKLSDKKPVTTGSKYKVTIR